MIKNLLLIFVLSLLWPVLHVLLFLLRFGKIENNMLLESLVFAPIGLISSVVLVFLLKNSPHKKWVYAGYFIAIPFSLLTSLLGGLIVTPIIGTTIFGVLPLFLGASGGYLLSRRIKRNKP